MKNTRCLLLCILLFFLCLATSPGTEEGRTFPEKLAGEELYRQGLQEMAQQEYGKAAESFQEATRRKANFAEAYLNLGVCYLNLSEFDKARQALVTARFLASTDQVRKQAQRHLEEVTRRQTAAGRAPDVQPAPAGLTPEEEARRRKEEERLAAEARKTLEDLGLTGTVGKLGFSIESVKDGSLGRKAGLNPGDIISTFDDKPILSLSGMASSLRSGC